MKFQKNDESIIVRQKPHKQKTVYHHFLRAISDLKI